MKRRSRWLILAGLLVVVAAVYVRAVGFGHMHGFDDNTYLFNRPEVEHWWRVSWWQRLTTPKIGYWIPVPTFVYAHLRAASPELYVPLVHGLNIALHVANVGLVYLLVSRWSTAASGLIVAAIWGLHPVQVESVAWLTNLKSLLFATAVLTGLFVWDRYLCSEPGRRRTLLAVATTLVCYLVALGCKPVAVVFPGLLLLQSWFRRRTWWLSWEVWGLVVCQAGLAAVYLPVALSDHGTRVTGLEATQSVWRWYARIARAFELSLRNLLVPTDLGPAYYATSQISTIAVVPGTAALAAVGLTVAALWMRRRWRLLLAAGIAAVTYLPYAQLHPIPRLAADTYLYLPSVGVICVIVWSLARHPKPDSTTAEPRRRKAVAGLAICAVLAVLGMMTHTQLDRWRNPVTLWKPVLVEHPRVWRPYEGLAEGYKERGQWARAAAVLEKGLPVFRASRYYPKFLPLVFEKVGEPKRAWSLAAEALRRHRSPSPFHYEVYLGLLARHDLPLPDDERAEELTDRAVDLVTSHAGWMSVRQHRLPFANYFVRHDRPQWALPFLRREFEADQPHCLGWILYHRLPEDARAKIGEIPAVPDRCRE